MENIINSVGGFDSWGFVILVFGTLIIGSILNALNNLFIRVVGLGLFMFGGILLYEMIMNEMSKNPNLPEGASILPVLFVVALLLTVFKMAFNPISINKNKPK